MDKLYFAKYLPIEGEIKEGDWGFHKERGATILMQWKSGMPQFSGDKLAKLFLCSRDFQVGDKVRLFSNPTEEINVPKNFLVRENGERFVDTRLSSFKVIGEISPEATWVKEGQEFDEDEVALGMGNNNYILSDIKTVPDPQNILGKKWYIPKENWSKCKIRIKDLFDHFH